MEKVLYESSNITMKLMEDNNTVSLKSCHYPLKGYGNRVCTGITVDVETGEVSVWEARYSWGGTGSKELAEIVLTPEEAKELAEKVKRIRKPEDFDRLVEYVVKLEAKYDDEWEKSFDALLEKLYSLEWVNKLANADLNDKDFREALRQWVEEYWASPE